MSFITKRERVFNEYDLFDLPARNEGKLKAYASCTDARAWSHFCSDKTEHLVEIIKRNNEKCRPKYVPTEVIVNCLMAAKNAEISRLKRKIEEFEQMLAAYDQLELTPEQKSEIANAHAAIRAANKELDEMCLDLDLSGYTEGIDSESFETGKSRGDELSRSTVETAKSNKSEMGKPGGDEWYYEKPVITEMKHSQVEEIIKPDKCDVSTTAHDSRIKEMEDMIISKDAKLNAMHNTIAVLDNDLCEPYCIYVQIFTALEKIFGTLCQNIKYKQYLDLLTVGQDTRYIHIQGKILYKIKVLEKFSLALIAPCNKEFKNTQSQDCSCYHAQIVTRVEATYALTPAENNQTYLDNKRAHLVADIIDIEEIRDILNKESLEATENVGTNDYLDFEDYNINKENVSRIKKLQSNYEDLLIRYEELKCEKDGLYIRCQKLAKLENECESMQNTLREYNHLWNEKEYFRKRSGDLDKLKETYYVLLKETSNLEINLKAESDINKNMAETVKALRDENIALQKKLSETAMAFEKERNILICKLKECECNIMCQEQQIKCLSRQHEKLLKFGNANILSNEDSHSFNLRYDVISPAEKDHNPSHVCLCHEDENLFFQEEFEENLKLINEMKFEIESWKCKYDQAIKTNDSLHTQIEILRDENQVLSNNIENKASALENLLGIIENKSKEIDSLNDEMESKRKENRELLSTIQKIREKYHIILEPFENGILLNNDEDRIPSTPNSSEKKFKDHANNNESLNNDNEDVLQEIKLFHKESTYTIDTLSNINENYKTSLELTKKQSVKLENELLSLKEDNEYFLQINEKLRNELFCKDNKLRDLIESCEKEQRENKLLRNQLQHLDTFNDKQKNDLINKAVELSNLQERYQVTKDENETLRKSLHETNTLLYEKENEMENLKQSINDLELKYYSLQKEFKDVMVQKSELQVHHDENLAIRSSFEALKKDNIELNNKIKYYKNQNTENKKLISENREIKMTNEKLQHDLLKHKENLENLKERNKICEKEKSKIISEAENLKKGLVNAQREKDLQDKEIQIIDLQNYNKELKLKMDALKMEVDKLYLNKHDLHILLDNRTKDLNIIDNKTKDHRSLSIQTETQPNLSKGSNDDLSLKHENLILIPKDKKEDSMKANREFDNYENLQQEYEKVKSENHKITMENEKLKHALFVQNDNLKKSKEEFEIIKKETDNILAEKEVFQKMLQNAQNEVISANNSSHFFYNNIRQEIDALKREKEHNDTTILELTEKLNKAEECILTMKEDISRRDITISDLQNHINNLQDEIRHLHQNLSEALESGEDLSKHRLEKIYDSERKIEAHYSKATHNMKMELAKLRDENNVLQNQSLKTKLNLRDLDVDKHKYVSQVVHHQNEREKIMKHLKVLELKTLGYSNLNLNSNLEDILISLDRIWRSFDEKNTSLKKTLLHVRDSYQLLETKADEARTIAENEKQKILDEKENAKQERINIQEELNNMKLQLTSQELKYEEIIKELEAKMLNQKLIFDQVHESKENYINKLKEEIHTLNEICDKSHGKIKKLQEKYDNSLRENKKNNEVLTKLTDDFEKKVKESQHLQKQIEKLRNTVTFDVNLQTEIIATSRDQVVQTNSNAFSETYTLDHKNKNCKDEGWVNSEYNVEHHDVKKDSTFDNFNSTKYAENNVHNEVQVLTANIKPSLDFFKNIYINYKINRLQTQTLEQYSYTSLVYSEIDNSSSLTSNKNFYENSRLTFDELDNNTSDKKYNEEKQYNTVHTKESLLSSSVRKDCINLNNAEDLLIPQEMQKLDNSIKNLNEMTKNYYKIEENYMARSLNKQDTNINITENVEPNHNNLKNKEHMSNLMKTSVSSLNTATFGDKKDYKDSTEVSFKVKVFSDTLLTIKNSTIFHEKPLKDILKSKIEPEIKSISTSASTDSKPLKEILETKIKSEIKSISISASTDSKPIKDILEMKIKSEIKSNSISASTDSKQDKGSNEKFINLKTAQSVPSHVSTDMDFIDIDLNKNIKSEDEFKMNNIKEEPDIYLINNFLKSGNRRQYLASRKSSSSYVLLSDSSPTRDKSILIITSDELRDGNKTEKTYANESTQVKLDKIEDYEKVIENLTKSLEDTENEYIKKMEAVKLQYENNVKSIINEHNQGVQCIQNLHEETLSDIIKIHDTEIENLRSLSIDAMRKVEKLEKENRYLKMKQEKNDSIALDQKPIKLTSPEHKKRKYRSHTNATMLTKTEVVALNVKPKRKALGPCTCSLDINISDTIRNIFEQVDEDQRKLAEQSYLKYIAGKLLNNNVEVRNGRRTKTFRLIKSISVQINKIESLNPHELSFLHLKVCRIWKSKLNKQEALKMKIDSLEKELMNKQRQTQKHISELDQRVAEERLRLQEVRKAICRNSPAESRDHSPQPLSILATHAIGKNTRKGVPGDRIFATGASTTRVYQRRGVTECNRAALAQLDVENHKEQKFSKNEAPIRLRRSHDRHKTYKKN